MLRARAAPAALVAVLTGLLASGSAQGATAPHAALSRARHTYAASTQTFANPERGFYRYSEAHLTADGQDYTPLDAAALARARTDSGVTLIFRYYYLDAYRTEDTIAASDLARVAADLAAVRTAGVKVIVRFAYSAGSSADAPVRRVIKHIDQLAPVLNGSSDVIEAVQAGFIGRWGEWYYTDDFASDPSTPWSLSADDWANRRAVLLELLDATSSSLRVQVRYPAIKQHVFPDDTDPRAARVGVHDDCFVASADDFGTFASATDRAWLAEQSASTLVGGETCAASGSRSLWPSASADLARYHWTFLNADFDADVLGSWGAAGRAEAARRLGYRMRLTTATLPTRARPGATIRVSVSLANDGYSAPVQSRPVRLVLRSARSELVYPLVTDTRTWAPGRAVTLSAQVRAPTVPGGYAMYLDLPDSSAGLRTPVATVGGDSVKAAYSVRLANTGTWDAGTGYNSLAHVLSVGP